MKVGTPVETLAGERRVGITPEGTRELCLHGHQVVVQAGAGAGAGIEDDAYRRAGAEVVETADELFGVSDLVVKVKQPLSHEVELLRPGQLLFTYLHLPGAPELRLALEASEAVCVAYETIEDDQGGLPLLNPMSEIAGRLAPQVAATALTGEGARGVLLSGVAGVSSGDVVVIGGGTAGAAAARAAHGLGARVAVMDVSLPRLRELDAIFDGAIETVYATSLAVERRIATADVVIGAVLVRGRRAPHVLRRDMLAGVLPGAVLVDIAIDEGGCFETSRATSHDRPTFVEEGVVHYCVPNMPAAVPRTATYALTNATLPYVTALADGGYAALEANPVFRGGLNVDGAGVVGSSVAAVAE